MGHIVRGESEKENNFQQLLGGGRGGRYFYECVLEIYCNRCIYILFSSLDHNEYNEVDISIYAIVLRDLIYQLTV